jgi:hypothetical protein
MNAEQALKILEEVTANVNANRQTHLAVAQALKVLREAVEPKTGSVLPKKEK